MPSLLISQNEQKNPPWPHVHFVSNADETVFCISNLIRTLEFCLQHSDRRKCIPCVVAWSLNLHLQRIARPALRVVGGRLAKVGERYCSTVQGRSQNKMPPGSAGFSLKFNRGLTRWKSVGYKGSVEIVGVGRPLRHHVAPPLQSGGDFFMVTCPPTAH